MSRWLRPLLMFILLYVCLSWWGERVNYYFNDKPIPWMFREKKRLILLQNCQNKKCKPEKRRKKRTVLPRRELNVNEMKISFSICLIYEAHPWNAPHLNISYMEKGKENVCIRTVSVCVSVLTCCHAQAVFFKPPTRVKPWFYRASKREIGCCTAQMYPSLLLLSCWLHLSVMSPVQCVADGLRQMCHSMSLGSKCHSLWIFLLHLIVSYNKKNVHLVCWILNL